MKKADFIKNEIMKTGFPLEMKILSILNSGNWFAVPSQYYFDYDLNIAREIDIQANLETYNKASNFEIFPSLAIECKKSETHAWVFFETKLKSGRFGCMGQYADFIKSQNIKSSFHTIRLMLSDLIYEEQKSLAMSYKEIKLQKVAKGRDLNEIFEAINQVVKYVIFEIGDYLDAYRNRGLSASSCVVFLPVIVFDGELYLANLKNSKVSLRKVKNLLFLTFYKPKYETRRVPFLIDIVNKGYFPTYLSNLEKKIDNLNRNVEKIKDIQKEFIDELESIK
jgi:hypothetical protein